MNLFWAFVILAVGLAVLWKSAGVLVGGAVGISRRLGISQLVIGLTVVAMGTSAPEVAASIAAAIKGIGDVAVGNVYGSNIANLALVGGLCAIICPMKISLRILRREVPVMLVVGLLLWPIVCDLNISRVEGFGLLGVFAVLIILTVYFAKKEGAEQGRAEVSKPSGKVLKNAVFILIGLVGLVGGAKMTLQGAVFVGQWAGLSEAVIGLTIIALGTSLPELVTCVVASAKGHHDISIGNLVGSNIFNTLLVTGTAGVIRPFALADRLAGMDYWIMIVISGAFVVMAAIGKKVSRTDGTILLTGYVAYMVYVLVYTSGV